MSNTNWVCSVALAHVMFFAGQTVMIVDVIHARSSRLSDSDTVSAAQQITSFYTMHVVEMLALVRIDFL